MNHLPLPQSNPRPVENNPGTAPTSAIGLSMRQAIGRAQKRLEPPALEAIISFIRQQWNPDGGFRGRSAASDLYYTVFGLECLSAFGYSPSAESVRTFLDGFGDGSGLDFVHLTCLARCRALVPNAVPDLGAAILRRLEGHRSSDGGYHHVIGSNQGLIYESFLAWLAYEGLRVAVPAASRLSVCLLALQASDGGFANHGGLPSGTTPVTAAAAVLLAHLGLAPACAAGAPNWLLARCQREGGFLATPQSPVPDLLSTATALHALATLHQPVDAIREACLDFVESLWTDQGGFCGHPADETADCEYTFYGLLALGQLL